MDCDRCGEAAVTLIRYSGQHLCADDFRAYVERRAKRAIRKQLDLTGDPVRIACALSGGKDSTVATYLLHAVLGPRPDVDLVAVTVDEGVEGYRPPSVDRARALCRDLGLPHRVLSHRDLVGWETDAAVEADPDTIPCSYCGVFRRKALNVLAREAGADVVATGLNLDDTVQTVLMNLGRGDLERVARMGPHRHVQPGLVPRIQPLLRVPEKEAYLYAVLQGLPFHDGECPYAHRGQRHRYRELVYALEADMPGTRHALLRSTEELKDLLQARYPPADLVPCQRCGEPTVDTLCQACKLADRLAARAVDGAGSVLPENRSTRA